MDDARISLIAGFLAGLAEVCIGYPFDTIKTRLQTAEKLDGMHTMSAWSCAVSTFKSEGLAGFYRGIAAPMLQEALGVALLFGARDWLRTAIGAEISRPGAFILACCLIGLMESLIYCPLDHLKARMQVKGVKEKDKLLQVASPNSGLTAGSHLKDASNGSGSNGGGELAGILSCARQVLRARGPLGLYTGFILQASKEMVGNIALFGTYDLIMMAFSGGFSAAAAAAGAASESSSSHGAHMVSGMSWLIIWPAGSLAGMAYYILGYPLDTVKSKLQTDSLSNPRYRNSLHCLWRVVFVETNFFELFRGVSMCLARAIPGCAVQFFVFEFVCKTFMDLSTSFVPITDFPELVSDPTLNNGRMLDIISGWSR